MSIPSPLPKYYLDITAYVCPMTFVRTKLLIEKIPAGAEALIRLNFGEPLNNVPRSLKEHGHDVIELRPEDPSETEGPYLLRVRKKN